MKQKPNRNIKPPRYPIVSEGYDPTVTIALNDCEHKTGWYGYVPFLLFRRRIFVCSDCGIILYGKALRCFRLERKKTIEPSGFDKWEEEHPEAVRLASKLSEPNRFGLTEDD